MSNSLIGMFKVQCDDPETPWPNIFLYISSTIPRFACPNNRTIPPHKKRRVAPTIHNESVWHWHFTLWKRVTLTITNNPTQYTDKEHLYIHVAFNHIYFLILFPVFTCVCETSRSVLVLRRLLVTVNQQSLIKLGSWRVCRNGGSTI